VERRRGGGCELSHCVVWLRCAATLEISVPIEILRPWIRGRNSSTHRLVLHLHPLPLATVNLCNASRSTCSPQLFPSQRASTGLNSPPTTSTACQGPSKSRPNSPTPHRELPTRGSPTSTPCRQPPPHRQDPLRVAQCRAAVLNFPEAAATLPHSASGAPHDFQVVVARAAAMAPSMMVLVPATALQHAAAEPLAL
jgi:hypothetical protein